MEVAIEASNITTIIEITMFLQLLCLIVKMLIGHNQ